VSVYDPQDFSWNKYVVLRINLRGKIYYVVDAHYNERISTAVPLFFMHDMSSIGKRVPKNRAILEDRVNYMV